MRRYLPTAAARVLAATPTACATRQAGHGANLYPVSDFIVAARGSIPACADSRDAGGGKVSRQLVPVAGPIRINANTYRVARRFPCQTPSIGAVGFSRSCRRAPRRTHQVGRGLHARQPALHAWPRRRLLRDELSDAGGRLTSNASGPDSPTSSSAPEPACVAARCDRQRSQLPSPISLRMRVLSAMAGSAMAEKLMSGLP